MIDSSYQCVYYTNCLFTNTGLNIQCWNEVVGIEKLSINNSLSYADDYLLGGFKSPLSINAPMQTSITIDKNYVDKEIFNKTLFSQPSCFYIYNGAKYHVLTNSYLTNYSVSFSVGDIPKISSKFSSFEYKMSICNTLPSKCLPIPFGMSPYYNMQQINTDSFPYNYVPVTGNYPDQVICKPYTSGTQIIKLNSIYLASDVSIQCNDNIYAFDYSLSYNRQALFSVGDIFPRVETLPPIKVCLSIYSKVKNESLLTNLSMPSIPNNLYCICAYSWIINVSGSSIDSYYIYLPRLESQEIQFASCDFLDVKRNYVGVLL